MKVIMACLLAIVTAGCGSLAVQTEPAFDSIELEKVKFQKPKEVPDLPLDVSCPFQTQEILCLDENGMNRVLHIHAAALANRHIAEATIEIAKSLDLDRRDMMLLGKMQDTEIQILQEQVRWQAWALRASVVLGPLGILIGAGL